MQYLGSKRNTIIIIIITAQKLFILKFLIAVEGDWEKAKYVTGYSIDQFTSSTIPPMIITN